MPLLALSMAWMAALAAVSPPGSGPVLRTPSLPEWQLLRRVDPAYPPAALDRRIQGVVRFAAIIGKDGHVESLRLISGHPLLVRAAANAVRQWVYAPSSLHGKPVRVLTQIEVPFALDPYGRPLRRQNEKPRAGKLGAALRGVGGGRGLTAWDAV